MGWQSHQLDHIQIICTLLQTGNHASSSPLSFYRPDALPTAQPTASKHWRQIIEYYTLLHCNVLSLGSWTQFSRELCLYDPVCFCLMQSGSDLVIHHCHWRWPLKGWKQLLPRPKNWDGRGGHKQMISESWRHDISTIYCVVSAHSVWLYNYVILFCYTWNHWWAQLTES